MIFNITKIVLFVLFLFNSSGILINFKSNHQENLENNIQVKLYKNGRNPNLISYYLFDSSVFFDSGFHNPNYLEIKNDLTSKFLNLKTQIYVIQQARSKRQCYDDGPCIDKCQRVYVLYTCIVGRCRCLGVLDYDLIM